MCVGVSILETPLDNGMALGHQSFQGRGIFCRLTCTSRAKMKAFHVAGRFTLGYFHPLGSSLHSSCLPRLVVCCFSWRQKNSPVKVIISRNNSFSDKPLAMKNVFFFVRFLDPVNKKILNKH